eukprot:tig00020951_g16448.t1
MLQAALPKTGEKFTIQENASSKCLFFDETQKDAWGDWALRAETCDPTAANLAAKFLWSYNDLTGTTGDNLEAEGWHGLGNQGRIPDLPNFCSSNCGSFWKSGHLIRGWTTQTTDPDARVKWVQDSSLTAVGTGGVAVKIATTDVSNAAGFWHYDSGTQQIQARNQEASNQAFTIRVRAQLDEEVQAAEDDDALDLAIAEEEAEADAMESVLAEAPAAEECLSVA